MGAARFYHLVNAGVTETVAALAGRAVAQGMRVAIRSPDAARLAALDLDLWRRPEEGFLPHGLAGGPHDARQPVLLTAGGDPANGAQGLILLDGATVDPAQARALERVWVVFPGDDEGAVAQARDQWRALTGAGIAAEYWNDSAGGWQKKADHPGSPAAAAPGAGAD